MESPFSHQRQCLPGQTDGQVFEWWDVKFFEQVLARANDEYLATKLVTLLNNYIKILSVSQMVVATLETIPALVDPAESRLGEILKGFCEVVHEVSLTSGVNKI